MVWQWIRGQSQEDCTSQRKRSSYSPAGRRSHLLLSSDWRTCIDVERKSVEVCWHTSRCNCEFKPKKWWELTNDSKVGFVPNHNPQNIAQPIALYLSLWKNMSSSLEVPFPGTFESYKTFHSDCSQDQLARFTIYVSLHPEQTAGESFNIADIDQPISWEMVWPGICEYFGLKAVKPVEGETQLSGESWITTKSSEWESWETQNKLKNKVLARTCWDFMTIAAWVR